MSQTLDTRRKTANLHKLIRIRSTENYDKDDVIKAARLYLIKGNYTAVARELGIHVTTIKRWSEKDWWPVIIEELRFLRLVEIDGKYSNILDKSLETVLDRLENGDEVVVGKEICRKKVSARDAALISAIMFDKQRLLHGDPTQIAQHNFDVDERLGSLMNTFEQIAAKSQEKVIDGEVIEDKAKELVNQVNDVVNLPPFKQELENE